MSETSIIVRTGAVVSLSAPAGLAPKFFRIAIADVDTDGDGVNDWEEYKLGLDPTQASSNNQLDGVGQPLGDYAYAAGKLASQNVITITATDPAAIQPDQGQSAIAQRLPHAVQLVIAGSFGGNEAELVLLPVIDTVAVGVDRKSTRLNSSH